MQGKHCLLSEGSGPTACGRKIRLNAPYSSLLPVCFLLWGILCSSNRVTVSVYIVRVFLVHRTPSLLHPHLTVQQVMSPALPRDLARFDSRLRKVDECHFINRRNLRKLHRSAVELLRDEKGVHGQ